MDKPPLDLKPWFPGPEMLPIKNALPISHPNNFGVENYVVECIQCKTQIPTDDTLAEIRLHPTCIEIKAAAFCPSCRFFTLTTSRLYAGRMLHQTDTGWKTFTTIKWWECWLDNCKKFLGKAMGNHR